MSVNLLADIALVSLEVEGSIDYELLVEHCDAHRIRRETKSLELTLQKEGRRIRVRITEPEGEEEEGGG